MKIKTKKKIKRKFVNILLLISSLIFSIIVGEIVIRIFFPQKLSFNVSQWDQYVGFTNIPNVEGFSKKEDYKMHVKINSHGLRDREYEYQKRQDTLRMGVFGDSFTFGEGVQNNETYPKYLDNLFQTNKNIKRLGFNIEVINFGIGKTGTSHQLAFYQKEGKKYNLDIVIIGFISGNDFEDNWGGVFLLKNNELIHNPTAYSSIRKIQKIVYHIPFYKWVSMHSHLVNLFRKAATIYDDRIRTQTAKNLQADDYPLNDASYINKKVHLTWKLIEKFKKETKFNNSDLLLVNLPNKHQKVISLYNSNEGIPVNVKMCDKLLKIIKDHNIKVLDLVPVFSKLPTLPYYFIHDGHMTRSGHQIIASSIYEFILPDIFLLISEKKRRNLRDRLYIKAFNYILILGISKYL